MLTSVQKEILQNLINLYQTSDGKSVKGEDIAEVMNRNPGTIRNQMQSLRSLGLVKGVPGPQGGYKPTIEAYQNLKIKISEGSYKIPIYRDNKLLDDLSVTKIEFTSIPHPAECEAAVKIVGSIKTLEIGDVVSIGPTPVNNLGIMGEIVGRDDMDNIILLDIHTMRSIPKNTVEDIGTKKLVSLKKDDTLKIAAEILTENDIEGAPIIENNEAIGIITLSDIAKALSLSKENLNVEDIMVKDVITISKSTKFSRAVEMMYRHNIGRLIITDSNNKVVGIITRSDLIDSILNIKEFPIISSLNKN